MERESLHALRRQLFFANHGRLNRRRPDDQNIRAQCLTLLTNAINHLSPINPEHINLYGRYDFTNPTTPPLGQLRPLRHPT